MLKSYEKFNLVDPDLKSTGIFIEVNWEEDNERINECKILKITLPDGQVKFIKKEILNELLFALGTPTEQQKLIPQKLTKVRWYETVLSVKAQKDIRKGENITFPIKISLPAVEEEIIGEIKKEYKLPELEKTKSGIYIPKGRT